VASTQGLDSEQHKIYIRWKFFSRLKHYDEKVEAAYPENLFEQE
jgi:hypothetical protein